MISVEEGEKGGGSGGRIGIAPGWVTEIQIFIQKERRKELGKERGEILGGVGFARGKVDGAVGKGRLGKAHREDLKASRERKGMVKDGGTKENGSTSPFRLIGGHVEE